MTTKKIITTVLVVGIIIFFFSFVGCERIDAGNVGITGCEVAVLLSVLVCCCPVVAACSFLLLEHAIIDVIKTSEPIRIRFFIVPFFVKIAAYNSSFNSLTKPSESYPASPSCFIMIFPSLFNTIVVGKVPVKISGGIFPPEVVIGIV